jgi:hypothetical protein
MRLIELLIEAYVQTLIAWNTAPEEDKEALRKRARWLGERVDSLNAKIEEQIAEVAARKPVGTVAAKPA